MRSHTLIILILSLSTCFWSGSITPASQMGMMNSAIGDDSQNFNLQKDIAFGQIAAGGGYESVLTLTNRGTTVYSGILELYSGAGLPWNPTINGVPLINGWMDIIVNPGETKTYQITLSGNTEAAFGFIRSDDMAQSCFIEGNLTYFIYTNSPTEPNSVEDPGSFEQGSSLLFETVGVPPSTEFFKSTIPFDDFSSIALALANVNSLTANVKLTILSESNEQRGVVSIPLGPNSHIPTYLWQQFPGLTMERGRVEIESDVPIFGTAVTSVPSPFAPSGELFSSLPLLPSPYSYTFSTFIGGLLLEGEVGLWLEGPFAKGYIRLTRVLGLPNPPETFLFYGHFQNGTLIIAGLDGAPSVLELTELAVVIQFQNFSFSETRLEGRILAASIKDFIGGEGIITLTKIF